MILILSDSKPITTVLHRAAVDSSVSYDLQITGAYGTNHLSSACCLSSGKGHASEVMGSPLHVDGDVLLLFPPLSWPAASILGAGAWTSRLVRGCQLICHSQIHFSQRTLCNGIFFFFKQTHQILLFEMVLNRSQLQWSCLCIITVECTGQN